MIPKSLLIIGSGPGGYAAALQGAARGLSVTLVEDQPIGGTCVNRGCIPSKFLLSKSKQLADALKLHDSGIDLRLESVRLKDLLQQKNQVVDTLRQRIQQAVKASKVRFLQGFASFVSPQTMEVRATDGSVQTVTADAIILATGSTPAMPAAFPQHPAILNSTTVFDLEYLPAHLVVLGGGYIGSELACAFQGLGSKVTLIEKEARLLPTQPEFEAAAGVIQRSFEKRGMTVWTRTQVENVTAIDAQRLRLVCSNGESLEANALLLALGRAPNVQGLHLDKAGITLKNNRLTVNAAGQTNVPHIYALGDLVSPLPLAHTATAEAERVVDALFGETSSLDYSSVPRCVYTWPEAAAVGRTESQARDAGLKPRVDRYHFAASAKALAEGETEGFWMVVSDADSGKILGAQVVGSHATELIHLLALSIKAQLTLKDVAHTVFAHPTLSEGFMELASRATSSKVQNPKTNPS